MNQPSLRKATPADAHALAELMDQAGQGIPAWLWAQDAAQDTVLGQTPLDVGMARARRSEGAFCYPNATVLDQDGDIAGMLLAYLQPDVFDLGRELDGVPDFLVPVVELECLAPGSFYINAIAVYPQHRGRGYGALLIARAERLGRGRGAHSLSLVVFEDNEDAVEFYLCQGFGVAAERPVVPHQSSPHTGRQLLLTRAII